MDRETRAALDGKVIVTTEGRSKGSVVTVGEAKEILIEGMNYAAYRETEHSLWDSDKNRLFGSDHFHSGRWEAQPSTWGDGEGWEDRMGDLVRWAVWLDKSGRCKEAIRVLLSGDHYINHVIKKAKLRNV